MDRGMVYGSVINQELFNPPMVDNKEGVMGYQEFLDRKSQLGGEYGFAPTFIPEFLFPFQKYLVEWATRKGRSAIFADCGMGKTPMQLVWAENVVRHTNKPVLIVTPLAVSFQTVQEAEKFGIDAQRSHDGKPSKNITVTNYEQLHRFDWNDYGGMVCDESSILKNFDGKRKSEITVFMRKLPYRLLTTATAAPNDFIELGTSSEALGELGYMDMLGKFFKNDQNVCKGMNYMNHGSGDKWRLKGHAEIPFWRWVASWSRAIRKPSDFGFEDNGFILPPLLDHEHLVKAQKLAEGMLFELPAVGLKEQREESRRSIEERCEKVASLVDTDQPALVWCHLNDEGDYLDKIIPEAKQISGRDSDDAKEEKFMAFSKGQLRVLVTKPKIGAWGLNFQHCNHVTFFPTHSFEQYYQGVRRCWRFGQKRPVTVDIVTTEGGQGIMKNLQRKAVAADNMFTALVAQMNNAISVDTGIKFGQKQEVPQWLA